MDIKQLYFKWEKFCEVAKSEWRYTFFLNKDSNGIPLSDTILQVWECFKQEEDLIADLTQKESVFRGRKINKPLKTSYKAKELGTPKQEKAKNQNRFTPAGIPAFYGALDMETAKKEATGLNPYLVLGEFHVSKTIKLLDLVKALEISKHLILTGHVKESKALELLSFYSLAESVTNTVDNKLDYLPAQIFAEYVRRFGYQDLGIKGIKYPSTKNPNGENVVLFYSNEECVDEENADEDCLVLDKVYEYKREVSYEEFELMEK